MSDEGESCAHNSKFSSLNYSSFITEKKKGLTISKRVSCF
jgi:hypothetical protein